LLSEAIGKLRRVEYTSARISLTDGLQGEQGEQPWVKPDTIFRVKSTEWEYEKEWRWLECDRPSDYAEVVPAPTGELLFLRPVRPESVRQIILGHRADYNLTQKIQALTSGQDYKHVQLFKVVLHPVSYKLEIESL